MWVVKFQIKFPTDVGKVAAHSNEDTSWKVAFDAKYPVNFLTISRSKREIRKSLEI